MNLLTSEDLPEPSERGLDGDAMAWHIHGPLGVLWIPPREDEPSAVALAIGPALVVLDHDLARKLAAALFAARAQPDPATEPTGHRDATPAASATDATAPATPE
ncbi:hypothetical protein [Amycolatopsis sp. CA-230715]|uniref:hypothetical protein n=1 Tax=Amycolatopsis sp. CA-230715 TaxID=2745196 RepID=UPI001C019464|nr:hypothetical protein [Amycolatopsis sp. CA-230715]QWF78733.1 hypothetical protein HUW46_02131 [Amycolatopsis sp. CA-230715]